LLPIKKPEAAHLFLKTTRLSSKTAHLPIHTDIICSLHELASTFDLLNHIITPKPIRMRRLLFIIITCCSIATNVQTSSTQYIPTAWGHYVNTNLRVHGNILLQVSEKQEKEIRALKKREQ
jgi:hypothetical protein